MQESRPEMSKKQAFPSYIGSGSIVHRKAFFMDKYFSGFPGFRELLFSPDTPESLFSRLPALDTPRLSLRKMQMRDAADIYAWASDPLVSRYVLWDSHKSIADSRNYIRYIRRLYRQGLPSSWAMVLKETGGVIGTVGFMWYSSVNQSAEVGYSMSRSYWNRGLMTEALSAVLAFGFDRLGLHRVEAQFDVRNPASGKVMEKCGMRCEGVLRDRIRNKGEFIDVALYSMLPQDRKSL